MKQITSEQFIDEGARLFGVDVASAAGDGTVLLVQLRDSLVQVEELDRLDDQLAAELLKHGFSLTEVRALYDCLPGPSIDTRLLADRVTDRMVKLARTADEIEPRPAASGKGKGRGERHPAKPGRGRW